MQKRLSKAQKVVHFAAEGVLGLAFALVASLGVLSGGLWGGAAIGGGLLFVLMMGAGGRQFVWPDRAAMAAIGLLLFAVALSVPYGVDQHKSLYSLLKIACALIPLVFLLSPAAREKAASLLPHLPLLAGVTAVFLVVLSGALLYATKRYGFESGEVTKLNRGLSYALLFYIPLIAYLRTKCVKTRQKGAFFALILTFLVAFFLTHSRAAQMGLVLATLAFVFAVYLPRFTLWGMGLMCSLSVAWPKLANLAYISAHDFVVRLPQSWVHRVEIWDYLYYRITESPLLGHGIGTSHLLSKITPHSDTYQYMAGPAAHPHNAVVQLWVELGLLGPICWLLMCFLLLKRIANLSSYYRPYAFAAFAYAMGLLLSAYNFWADSLWGAMALTLLAFGAVASQKLKHS